VEPEQQRLVAVIVGTLIGLAVSLVVLKVIGAI
jgi:hypothetical protein